APPAGRVRRLRHGLRAADGGPGRAALLLARPVLDVQAEAVPPRVTGLLWQLAHPDVPEADRLARVAVRLELDGRRAVRGVGRLADVARLALELEVVLNQHAVVK